MERQEINLYSPEFRQGFQPLSSRRIVQCAVATFVVLMVVEGLTTWRLFANREQLQNLVAEQRAVSERLTQLKQNQVLSERPKLELEIKNLQAQVKRREELKSIIAGQNLGNSNGFSLLLEAMARQTIPDIALSQFRILLGGDYVELDGDTREPEAVPVYLQKLRGEDCFSRVRFGVLTIYRDEESGELKFSLGKRKEENA